MRGGFAMLGDFLQWWLRQIRALLPRRVWPDADRADALLVSAEDASDMLQISLSQRRRRREILLGRFHLDAAGRRALSSVLRQRPARVILRPDPTALLERKVTLPLAAEHDAARVLRYEMDRLTPFTAEQVFWSASLERRDRAAGRLEFCLSLMPKSVVQPLFAALAEVGLKVSAIETTAPSGAPRYIDLNPQVRHSHMLRAAAVLIGVLALAALVTPFVTQSLARRSVEAGIAALQPQIAQVEALRRRLAQGAAGNDAIAAEYARIGDVLQVLATVTALLPDDTVLADLSLRQGKLSISGRSRTAPQLIPAMAGDPTLHNPSFAAPVTRTTDGKADTFVIRAELSP